MFKNYLYVIVLLFNILYTYTISYNQPRLLTNSTNKHSTNINILKTNDDYSTVYSVDSNGTMKIWKFNITNLEFRQEINIYGIITW